MIFKSFLLEFVKEVDEYDVTSSRVCSEDYREVYRRCLEVGSGEFDCTGVNLSRTFCYCVTETFTSCTLLKTKQPSSRIRCKTICDHR